MSMVINHNMMAMNAARNLGTTYGKLSTSVQRLSSGLRINSAADDAAGLAIREMMRADIATTKQGIRNAADAISMIQTADGGLAVIDEKLTRMKELAEQAATGTYTTIQREIINSEYQAMAAEIDRIANATNFNGIKLLDGSVSNQHGGQGVKIHFGVSNNAAEDYYFVNIGDARATSSTGLRVGGDAKNDIWGQGAAGSGPLAGPGCCTAGFPSLNGPGIFTSGDTFSFGYNWDWMENNDANLLSGKYLAGRYSVSGTDSLQNLIDKVNLGSQSRVGIKINEAMLASGVMNSSGTVAVCIGEESYYWGSARVADGYETTVYDVTAASPKGSYTPGTATKVGLYADSAVTSTLKSAGITLPGKLPIAFSQKGLEVATSADAKTSALSAYQSALSAATASINVASAVTLAATAGNAGSATSTDVKTTAAGIEASGAAYVDNTGYQSDGSFTVSTGIWADNKGNWTNSASIAASLGLTEVKATINIADVDGTDAKATVTIGGVTSSVTALHAGLNGTAIDAVVKQAATSFVNGQRTANSVKIDGAAGPVDLASTVTTNDLTAKDRIQKIGGIIDTTKQKIQIDDNTGSLGGGYTAESLASAINHNSASQFWAMTETAADGSSMVYVFCKDGGDNNSIRACEVGGRDATSRATLEAISFENVETGEFHGSGTSFTLGGQNWGTLSPVQTKANKGFEVWNLTLNGRDVGKERDLWIANPGELTTPGLDGGTINGMDRDAFVEIQNAADGNWAGAEVRTQSSAQESLDALTDAIVRKDKVRADLGAMQNRLENTITNLEIQAENLQASESRISDVDVATEMTEFTKNNVMTQAATSMLAQANSLSQLALSLLG